MPASSFTFAATANGAPATLVSDPAQNIGDKLSADVLPGAERKVGLVLALPAKPSEATVKVTFERTATPRCAPTRTARGRWTNRDGSATWFGFDCRINRPPV